MAHHLQHILSQWYPARDACRWVLGTVIHVHGSNYRKAGAMILINELGHYHGLISGGCLEKSLLNDVKKVLVYDRPTRVIYDSSEQGDMPWAMALGCGGRVTILLQPVSASNAYQHLDLLYVALQNRKPVSYAVQVDTKAENAINLVLDLQYVERLNADVSQTSLQVDAQGNELLVIAVKAQVHLLVFGGGLDAIPLVNIAKILGWQITLVDARAGYANAAHFPDVHLVHNTADAIELRELLTTIDAAIVMTHNIEMDALAVHVLQDSSARYVGLLGPQHRKEKVCNQAKVDASAMPLFGPMGLHIGGDLPESIALATLAECHQVLEANTRSIKENVATKIAAALRRAV